MDESFLADVQVSWSPTFGGQQVQPAIGVNNILDEDPPPCLSCDLNNFEGTLHPVPGRVIHARAAVKF
jgi:iron complex outermembrane recepter protein